MHLVCLFAMGALSTIICFFLRPSTVTVWHTCLPLVGLFAMVGLSIIICFGLRPYAMPVAVWHMCPSIFVQSSRCDLSTLFRFSNPRQFVVLVAFTGDHTCMSPVVLSPRRGLSILICFCVHMICWTSWARSFPQFWKLLTARTVVLT